MNGISDALNLNEELHDRDDGDTSCTSSLATTLSISEDADELYLGAEANSFDLDFPKKDEPDQHNGSTSNSDRLRPSRPFHESLIVMKEVYSSLDSNDTNRTFSSITSVVDLLKAREGDPGEVLAGLGFACSSVEYDKKDILSRFKPSALLTSKDNQFLDVISGKAHKDEYLKGNHVNYKDSIDKTEEWLAHHHSDQNIKPSFSSDKHNSPRTPSSSPSESAMTSGKRPLSARTVKLRRKFSKSRQSSFELQLPNLKEEDANVEGEFPTSKGLSKTSMTTYSPIREKSIEPSHSSTQAQEPSNLGQKIPEAQIPGSPTFPRNRNFSRSDVFQFHDDVSASQVADHINTLHVNEDKKSKLIKSNLLVDHQVESFELEEINSNNGEGTEWQRHRRFGVIVTTPDVAKSDQSYELLKSPSLENVSDENETSSGFDEDEVNTVPPILSSDPTNDNNSCRQIVPDSVVETVETGCPCGSELQSSTTTRYVYNVTLGENRKSDKELTSFPFSPNRNDNNNEAISKQDELASPDLPSKPVNVFSPNHFPLRHTNSQGAGYSINSFIVTPVNNAPVGVADDRSLNGQNGVGNPRRLLSHRRRRRKEFADRSALSGDSIGELYDSCLLPSTLLQQNGHYAVRKRRPGCFYYYKNSQEFRENGTDDLSADSNSPSPDLSRIHQEKSDMNQNVLCSAGDGAYVSYGRNGVRSRDVFVSSADKSKFISSRSKSAVDFKPLLFSSNAIGSVETSSTNHDGPQVQKSFNNYKSYSTTDLTNMNNNNNNVIRQEGREKPGSKPAAVLASTLNQTEPTSTLKCSRFGQCCS